MNNQKIKQMENTLNSRLSPEMYESLIHFQEARIEALEKRNNLLEYLHQVAISDSISTLQAQSDTLDWIENRLLR